MNDENIVASVRAKKSEVVQPSEFTPTSSRVVVKSTLYHQPSDNDAHSVTSAYTYECADGDMYQRNFDVGETPQPIDKDGRSWVEKHGMIVIVNTGDADLEMGNWRIYQGQSFHGQPIQFDELKINTVKGNGKYTITIFPEG